MIYVVPEESRAAERHIRCVLLSIVLDRFVSLVSAEAEERFRSTVVWQVPILARIVVGLG